MSICSQCKGTGQIHSSVGGTAVASGPCPRCHGGGTEPSGTSLSELGWGARIFVAFVLLCVAIFVLLVGIVLWATFDGTLRWILETLPLGGAVATTPSEHGRPLLIAVLTAVVVIGAVYGLTRWRGNVLGRYIDGTLSFPLLAGASFARTFGIVAGICLIPVTAGIAAAHDLGPDANDPGPLFNVVPIVLAVGAVVLLSRWELRRVVSRARAQPSNPSRPHQPRIMRDGTP